MALSDQIVVMDRGKIEQVGTPRQVYNEPATVFVARFIGGHNVVAARLAGVEGDKALLTGAGAARFRVENPNAAPGAEIAFAVRADKIAVRGGTPEANGTGNLLPGRVRSVEYQGAWVQVGIEAPEVEEFTVTLGEQAFYAAPVAVGDSVVASWDEKDVHVLS